MSKVKLPFETLYIVLMAKHIPKASMIFSLSSRERFSILCLSFQVLFPAKLSTKYYGGQRRLGE